ncbi:hypothetical protein SK854_45825 [Lentzea sp. BCCO 10_0061]|uniref:Uncharacterized protein n=1 Tax=Lentzea sokolovensis TaxID=3095429 RepID=A0ABU4VF59_9PSEU|nr:hypothetical protein [Lentzea sp. BCCO 10_0061]MDX8149510.1 hypothetical protein [Lentzea sp. BCCO 10_0061]
MAAASAMIAPPDGDASVAVTVFFAMSLRDGTGFPAHSGFSGVRNAHSGNSTSRNREAQSPPCAQRYDE